MKKKTRKRTGYLLKRGDTFYAVWQIDGKKHMKTTGTSNRKEAKKELARIMEPLTLGDNVKTLRNIMVEIGSEEDRLAVLEEANNPPMRLSKAWDAFLSSTNRRDTGPNTLDQYALQFARFEKWMKEHHPEVLTLQGVTPAMADEFVGWLHSEGKSANTYNKYVTFLRMAFSVLFKTARLKVNPWADITKKKEAPSGRRELTLAELRNVCETADGDLRLLLALGIYTGLRLGDVCTLRWCEVDLLQGMILRTPNKTQRSKPDKVVHIPVHPTLATMLAEIPARSRGEYVLPKMAEDYRQRSDYITDQVQKHFEKCGIKTHKPGTGYEIKVHEDGRRERIETGKRAVVEVGFHSLRHSFVSLCRAAGTPLSVVEAIVGHSNPAMTRHYTHTGDAAALAAVSALPSMAGEPAKSLPPAPVSRVVDADAVLSIAEGLTAKTWKAAKAELMALVKGAK